MSGKYGAINNNDDWARAAVEYVSDVMSKYMTGQPISIIRTRLIDNIRAEIGIMPESPQRYCDRILNEEVRTNAPYVP